MWMVPKWFGQQLAIPTLNLINFEQPNEEIMNQLAMDENVREVIAKKIYLCGEETESLGWMEGEVIAELLKDHSYWFVEEMNSGKIILSEYMVDLFNKCKENAYFGLDDKGSLSLFDGLPINKKIVRSFFQLNVEYLESSLPGETYHQLIAGIRVNDFEEYNSVLSTFSDYALDITEKS